MNKEFEYSDKIEAYLRNELSESEKVDFEHILNKDPLLRSELLFQKEIISTIRDRRKAELKQRLDRIQIKGTNNGFSGNLGVAGAVIGGAAIVGIAGWLTINNTGTTDGEFATTNSITPEAPLQNRIAATDADADGPLADESSAEVAPEAPATSKPSREVVSRSAAGKPKAAKPALSGTEVTSPAIPSDDVLAAGGNAPVQKNGEVELPYSSIASSTGNINDYLIVIDNSNPRYQLHYKFSNGQLTLYGFEKPYRIIDVVDMNDEAGKQRYLYYNGKFYYLNRNQQQVAPLQEITDIQLIAELNTKKDKMIQ